MTKTIKTGTTGDCTWTLDTDGLLTISGSGTMRNYTASSYVPWGKNIKSVVIENGVTSIGQGAFGGWTRLANVKFGGNSELNSAIWNSFPVEDFTVTYQ